MSNNGKSFGKLKMLLDAQDDYSYYPSRGIDEGFIEYSFHETTAKTIAHAQHRKDTMTLLRIRKKLGRDPDFPDLEYEDPDHTDHPQSLSVKEALELVGIL